MTVYAWHFCCNDMITSYDNLKIVPGEWLEIKGTPVPRKCGFHACETILDALMYAQGTILCRVELAGIVEMDRDVLCAQKRRVVEHADMLVPLVEFAEHCVSQMDSMRAMSAEKRFSSELDRPAFFNFAEFARHSAKQAVEHAINGAGSIRELGERVAEKVRSVAGYSHLAVPRPREMRGVQNAVLYRMAKDLGLAEITP